MNFWLVNPFDPLPGEREQLGRYAALAQALRARGHEVVWWSSAYSHRFKRTVDQDAVRRAAADWGIEVRLTRVPPYRGNVSLRRLWNHRVLGRRFQAEARRAPRPDLILASSPPLESAAHATRLGRAWGVPVVLDIKDQWPDNFARVLPRWARGAGRGLLAPYYALERTAYRGADGIVGVAQGYVERGTAVGGRKRWEAVFPLGVDVAEVRGAMARGAAEFGVKWRKPPGQTWLLYSGSHSYMYDFLTIVRAAIPAQRRWGERVRFILTGTGELAPRAHALVREAGLRNVTLAGFLEFPEWACLLSQVDAGFNASFPEALIYFPNKIFYYLAAGAAVLNTIPGQCARLVEEHGCGLNYTAGDVEGCLAAVQALVDDEPRLLAMGAAARRLAEDVFDRRIVYAEMAVYLETVAGSRSSNCGG